MILVPVLTTSLIHFSLKGWENVLLELGSERVIMNLLDRACYWAQVGKLHENGQEILGLRKKFWHWKLFINAKAALWTGINCEVRAVADLWKQMLALQFIITPLMMFDLVFNLIINSGALTNECKIPENDITFCHLTFHFSLVQSLKCCLHWLHMISHRLPYFLCSAVVETFCSMLVPLLMAASSQHSKSACCRWASGWVWTAMPSMAPNLGGHRMTQSTLMCGGYSRLSFV